MIGKLKGFVDHADDNHVLLDVGGVGYTVFCSGQTLRALPDNGQAATLFIETHVREDHIHLYGFSSTAEKESFLILTKVTGVGAKIAMAILSSLTPSQLANAIIAEDSATLTAISGVGPKMASRLLTELKGKFGMGFGEVAGTAPARGFAAPVSDINDAITALVGLGYSRSDAHAVITRIAAQNDNMALDRLITAGLRELGSR